VVSARIARLEDDLGIRLLHRTTRRLSLTDAGRELYERCAQLVRAADAAAEVAEGASAQPRGLLRINAPVTLAQQHLTPALVDFLALHPEVEVELTCSDHFVDVIAEGYDVVIRVTRLRDSSLVAKKLANDRLVIVASPAYLERAGVPEEPEDLIQHNYLHYTLVPLRAEWSFEGPAGPYVVPMRSNFASSDGTVLRQAAVAGLGLVAMPSHMVADEINAGRLRVVLGRHRRNEVGIYAVYPERRHVPAKVRAFVDFVAARFGKMRWDACAGKDARA
jgi:DNA-binding transcriptional LysR family regulator